MRSVIMHGRLRLAALLVTPEELGAIRSAARGRGSRLELNWLERPEDLEGLGPCALDVVVAVHGPLELDAMAWLRRPGRWGSTPVVLLCEEGTAAGEVERLLGSGAFAVVTRGRSEDLERAVGLALDCGTAGRERAGTLPIDLVGL